jgi:hypothetical protein
MLALHHTPKASKKEKVQRQKCEPRNEIHLLAFYFYLFALIWCAR